MKNMSNENDCNVRNDFSNENVSGKISGSNSDYSDVRGVSDNVSDDYSDVSDNYSDVSDNYSDVSDDYSDVNDDYSDIIGMPHHNPAHPRMSRAQRAAQFASFDALNGFDDEIEETAAARAGLFDKLSADAELFSTETEPLSE